MFVRKLAGYYARRSNFASFLLGLPCFDIHFANLLRGFDGFPCDLDGFLRDSERFLRAKESFHRGVVTRETRRSGESIKPGAERGATPG